MKDPHKFTDYELRRVLQANGYFLRDTDTGDDSRSYILAKVIRNAVEEFFLQEIKEEVVSNLLVDILKDDLVDHEDILSRIITEESEQQFFAPPPIPTYEIDEFGIPTGRKMVYENLSGGEHGWKEMNKDNYSNKADHYILLEKRHGVVVKEGYDHSHPEQVRYLRRTHPVSA